MKNYLIAVRYAQGLSAAVADDSSIDAIAKQLREFAKLYNGSAELKNVLSNESIRLKERMALLEEVMRKAEMPEVLLNLCKTLLRRHRITYLPDVARMFRRLADERLNKARARVVTAVEMDAEQQAKVTAALEKYSTKKIALDMEVDPEILGGVIAYLGSVIIDGSIKTRLERMRAQLAAQE
jgi:F-type H+-transporting ATPase subunit delta